MIFFSRMFFHTTPKESEYKARLKAIGVEISNDNNDDNSNNDGLLFDFNFFC